MTGKAMELETSKTSRMRLARLVEIVRGGNV